MLDFEEIERIIRRIDDDLVRAQYSLAIHKTTRIDKGLYRQDLFDSLSSKNSEIILRHIDLISQQDCALAIFRMMDKSKDSHSFWGLKNLCYPNKETFLERARNLYPDPDYASLANMLVAETDTRIDAFIS